MLLSRQQSGGSLLCAWVLPTWGLPAPRLPAPPASQRAFADPPGRLPFTPRPAPPRRHLLRKALGQALGPKAKQLLRLLEIKPAHDGSCLGAAVLALAAAS
jgi:hypothetical protein